MNTRDMRQPPSRCSSSSSIPNPTCISNGHQLQQPLHCHGKYPPFEYPPNRTSYHSAAQSTPRKELTSNSIFSFLQRFRAKNRSIFEDANSLPSSPRSTRASRTGYRWESVESVLSSATASSFAFIPPYQHQQTSTRISHKASRAPPAPSGPSVNSQRSARENCAFLRQKYNLHGSDATLHYHSRESIAGTPAGAVIAARSAKKLHRNSVGNVENLTARWPAEEFYPGRIRPYSEGTGTLQIRRSHCHRPGKRRAPQPPPTSSQLTLKAHRRPSGGRKKRKAPSPPKGTAMSDSEKGPEYAGAVYNDSLKLERGVLKANKETVASSVTSGSEASSVPVSPKPWYKRSSTQPNLKSVAKGSEKKKSCEQLLDEWMLEAGLPRSTSFYERKLSEPLSSPGASGESGNPKRRSQISMLANISELDREAAEILQQEREREREVAHSVDDKFYIGSSSVTLEQAPVKVPDRGTSSKRTTPKDLISILNAITNVTRITVNTTFFKETPSKSSASGSNSKSSRVIKSPDRQDRLTITELEDFDKETKKSPSQELVTSVQIHPQPPEFTEKKPSEPVKTVKPFSNWMCPQCTLENPSWKFICEACNKWRPYSVNRLPITAAKVSPKEDATLKAVDQKLTIAEDVSKSVRQRVHDMLASDQNLTSKAINDLLKPIAISSEAKVEPSTSGNLQFCENIEEVRKARLAFFNRSRLNDLNIMDGAAKPSNTNNAKSKNKCYSEEDRRKLREILKELKDSLPKSDLLGDKSSKRKVTVHSTKEDRMAQVEVKKTPNIDKETKSSVTAEAYFITKTTVVESPAKPSSVQASKGQKIELKVPVVEHKVEKGGETSTSLVGIEGIKINTKDLKPVPVKAEENLKEVKVEDLPVPEEKEFEGLIAAAEWKQSNMASSKENRNLTAITVNRLLKKLQTAIANGQHHEAANIARDLARLKVNCNMTRQDTPDTQVPPPADDIQNISIDIHVHEKNMPRDPIRLKVSPQMTINELQAKISKEHGIPVTDQQLIFGKHPISDVSATLDQIGVNSNGMIIFLKVSNSEASTSTKENKLPVNFQQNEAAGTSQQHTSKLLKVVTKPSTSQTSKASDSKSAATSAETGKSTSNESQVSNSNVQKVNTENTEDKSGVSKEIQPNGRAEWVCAICTLINEEKMRFCAVCGRMRQENSVIRIYDAVSKTPETKKEIPVVKPSSYHELMDLEKTDLISSVEAFDCAVCLTPYEVGEGVVLKECLHTFCRHCLSQTIEHCVEAEVKCPFRDAEYSCESVLQEREIKALVNAETFEKYLARSVAEAENKIKNAFHCKTANCRGWCIFEDNVNEFRCPVCSNTNCLTCQVIHSGLNCKQYQEVINIESETNADANRTRLMLQEMLQKGEAMTCPTCEVILMKKWGCDWLRCSMCKTEICWVTRGPRWGPKGKGDTSGGCRCGVNGVKCHQKCTFCH